MKKLFRMSWRAKRSHLKGDVLSNETASSLSLLAMTLVLSLLFGMVSCKKSSGLSGAAPVAPGNVSSASSASGTSTGTVFGGLTPVSGATVSLFQAGTNTAIATTTTNAQGSFNLPFTGASGLLYYKVTGGTPLGNPGGTSNSNIQMIGLVGSSSALPAGTIQINELTTAAFMTVAKLMGIVTDTSGTVTFSAPNNTATLNNIVTQVNNLITNGQYASGLSTAQQQSLGTVANAIAGCVENSGSCSTLMSTATNPSGGGNSSNILDAAVNMLNTTSSTTIGNVYTLAQKSAPTTGFTLSGSAPSVLSAQLALKTNTFTVGTTPRSLAIDSSGNIWVGNQGGGVTELNSSGGLVGTFASAVPFWGMAIDSSGNVWGANVGNGTVTEFNSSGGTVGTFSAAASSIGIAIDSNGGVWVTNSAGTNVVKLNLYGTSLGSFTVGSGPFSIAIDSSGNVWVPAISSNNVTELNSAGTTLGTFTVGTGPLGIAIDSSGNVWVANTGGTTISELNSSGTILATISSVTSARGMAFDSAGNLWIGHNNNNNISELTSSGTTIGTFASGSQPGGLGIDSSGNIWSVNVAGNNVTEIIGAAAGPEFFPYSGPVFPFSI